ncbi:hypothetical protein D9M72_356750 [compost metagenome]
MACGRGLLEFLEPFRPVGSGDLEEFERQLPPQRMLAGVEPVERVPVQLFRLHRIDEIGKIACQPDRIGRTCRRDQRAFRMDVEHDLW